MKKMLHVCLVLAGLALHGGPVSAQSLGLGQISDYMNQLGPVTADFAQYNDDGTVASGVFTLHRPGRARFEYAPPADLLVMAGQGALAIFDSKFSATPETYPLAKTPLSLVLGGQVQLQGNPLVVGHYDEGETTVVVAQDPENPEYGTIELLFAVQPLALQGWRIRDEVGGVTEVQLQPLLPAPNLPNRLFNIQAETASRQAGR
ncbi:MAG: LolA family protein [Lutimaribacter sp.]|jgi:outer membrane lipoprotein-sorting protein